MNLQKFPDIRKNSTEILIKPFFFTEVSEKNFAAKKKRQTLEERCHFKKNNFHCYSIRSSLASSFMCI